MFIYINIHSYCKLLFYSHLCLSVMLDILSCSFTFISVLSETVILLSFVSQCNVG
jgi:hypothetical protein